MIIAKLTIFPFIFVFCAFGLSKFGIRLAAASEARRCWRNSCSRCQARSPNNSLTILDHQVESLGTH